MRRDEAVTFLREIISTCSNMSPDEVSLYHSPENDTSSTGYQVHLKTVLDSKTKRQVQNIVQKYSLALKEERGKVVIYKPKEVIPSAQQEIKA